MYRTRRRPRLLTWSLDGDRNCRTGCGVPHHHPGPPTAYRLYVSDVVIPAVLTRDWDDSAVHSYRETASAPKRLLMAGRSKSPSTAGRVRGYQLSVSRETSRPGVFDRRYTGTRLLVPSRMSAYPALRVGPLARFCACFLCYRVSSADHWDGGVRSSC